MQWNLREVKIYVFSIHCGFLSIIVFFLTMPTIVHSLMFCLIEKDFRKRHSKFQSSLFNFVKTDCTINVFRFRYFVSWFLVFVALWMASTPKKSTLCTECERPHFIVISDILYISICIKSIVVIVLLLMPLMPLMETLYSVYVLLYCIVNREHNFSILPFI